MSITFFSTTLCKTKPWVKGDENMVHDRYNDTEICMQIPQAGDDEAGVDFILAKYCIVTRNHCTAGWGEFHSISIFSVVPNSFLVDIVKRLIFSHLLV